MHNSTWGKTQMTTGSNIKVIIMDKLVSQATKHTVHEIKSSYIAAMHNVKG